MCVCVCVSSLRKAALAHLEELIRGCVSLEMHHEETGRHQETHRQMDHHLSAVSGGGGGGGERFSCVHVASTTC